MPGQIFPGLLRRGPVLHAVQFAKSLEEAEDIVQGVSIKLWDQCVEMATATSLKAYLYRSVYNACICHFRQQKKKSELIETLKIEGLSSSFRKKRYHVLFMDFQTLSYPPVLQSLS